MPTSTARIESLPGDLRAIANDMLAEKFGKKNLVFDSNFEYIKRGSPEFDAYHRRFYDAWEQHEESFTTTTSDPITIPELQATADKIQKLVSLPEPVKEHIDDVKFQEVLNHYYDSLVLSMKPNLYLAGLDWGYKEEQPSKWRWENII